MRLLIDGVFFQLAQTGIARVWRSLLPRLVARPGLDLFILDRGGVPAVEGATVVPFPSFHHRYTADDSVMLQKICDHYCIDVFTSTYYTSPLQTPMLLLVYDMIPELLGFDLTQRVWMEKELSIAFARRFICISESTRADLLALYPEIPSRVTTVVHPGFDQHNFHPRRADEVAAFRRRFGIGRPYVLLVGSREQHEGYKNTRLLFQALSDMEHIDFDLLCVGGEPDIHLQSLAPVPTGCRVWRVDLSDEDLARAFSGAVALVCQSLYVGLGLPVLEAMASGCPVITTMSGSLAEVAGGGACLIIDGGSAKDMVDALEVVQRPDVRAKLVRKGLQRSAAFGWDAFVAAIEYEVRLLTAENAQGHHAAFFQSWRALRELQA
jgi:glycosyltransferase involved in cell wall biosynthesis